jgi:hypothetical protein
MTDTSDLRGTGRRTASTAAHSDQGPRHPAGGHQDASASRHGCACGYPAASADELTEHLGEMFIPADDVASDGQRHAERFRPDADGTLWECLCGFPTVEMQAFDAHLLAVFTPPNGIGADGKHHAEIISGLITGHHRP